MQNVCEECGKPFETDDDEYATICPDCWEKMVGESLENEGE